MPTTSATAQINVSMIKNGIMNRSQVFILTFTIASEGSNNPVGAMKDMIHMPYIYEFTISRPGMFTSIASAPIIGMVSTAMPEVDCINSENKYKIAGSLK